MVKQPSASLILWFCGCELARWEPGSDAVLVEMFCKLFNMKLLSVPYTNISQVTWTQRISPKQRKNKIYKNDKKQLYLELYMPRFEVISSEMPNLLRHFENLSKCLSESLCV